MRTIIEPREATSKVWGKQKVSDVEYRLMKYVLRNSCDDGTLLYNIITGHLVLLDEAEAKAIDLLPIQLEADCPDETQSTIRETLTPLIEEHFLVNVDFNEKKSSDQLRAIMRKLNRQKSITGYTILPTTGCNARCFYCYESDYPRRTMTPETADRLVEYMVEHLGEHKHVSIGWFGGEPMLGADIISRICKGLRDREIEYDASMISNGYLFTEELAKTAREEWKLNMIQITLDGTEEVYNNTKSYVGVNDNPYLRVLDNIGYLLDNEVSVSVRMNLDNHNREDLFKLIHELSERFKERDKFSAYVHTLFNDCGFDPIHHDDEENDALYRVQIELEKELRDCGIAHSKTVHELPILKSNFCMADNPGSLLVNPDGDFGKCEHYIYDHLVGGLDKETDRDAVKAWEEYAEWQSCYDCQLYPDCYRLKQCGTCNPCIGPEREHKINRLTDNVVKRYYEELEKQAKELDEEADEDKEGSEVKTDE